MHSRVVHMRMTQLKLQIKLVMAVHHGLDEKIKGIMFSLNLETARMACCLGESS